jgi:hypothetical protein
VLIWPEQNMGIEDDCTRTVHEAISCLGGLDVLVSNAVSPPVSCLQTCQLPLPHDALSYILLLYLAFAAWVLNLCISRDTHASVHLETSVPPLSLTGTLVSP